MSNFVKTIKREINDLMNCRGQREKCLVSTRALHALLDDYERLDTYVQATSLDAQRINIQQHLHHTIQAAYEQQNKNAETTLMLIMDTLRPLMEERHNQKEKWVRYE